MKTQETDIRFRGQPGRLNAELFSVISQCFAPVEEAVWRELTAEAGWCGFLEACRVALQNGVESEVKGTILKEGVNCPLTEFLNAGEVDALYSPPGFAEKRQFAAKHFTGGLPTSALPVESLYRTWTLDSTSEVPFAQTKGLYMGDSARYMQQVIARMGFELPEEYLACPDHLALELDLLSILIHAGQHADARLFLQERFEWLTAYRMKLLNIAEDARFYVGLVDVLVGIWSKMDTADDLSGEEHVRA